MKKLSNIILVSFLLVFLASCNSSDPEEVAEQNTPPPPTTCVTTTIPIPLEDIEDDRSIKGSYSFVGDRFTHAEINFEYPQLVKMKSQKTQEKVNQFIQTYVTNMTKDMGVGNIDWIDYLETTYEIQLNTPDLISIVFEGVVQSGGGSATSFAKGLTFDINTLQVFSLSDFVTLDENFAEKLLSSERVFQRVNIPNWLEEDVGLRQLFIETNSFDEEKLVKYLLTYENEIAFYVTPTMICVNFSVYNSAGDYVWVEVPLDG